MKRPVRIIFKLLLWLFLGIGAILVASFSLASYYKKDILAYFNTEIDKGITGSAHLNDINFTIFQQFPSVSVTLLGLTIKDSVYNSEIIKAEKVYLQVHLFKLLRKEVDVKSIVVRNATFNIFKDSLGYSNLSVFAVKKSQEDTTKVVKSKLMDFNLKKITFTNVALYYQDDIKGKKIHLACEDVHLAFKKKDENVTCILNGQIFTEGLLFNNLKGPFLENKRLKLDLSLNYHQTDSVLSLLPSTINIEDQQFAVEGRSRLNQKHPLIHLHIKTSDTDYDKAISILNKHLQKVLSKFHVEHGLSAQVDLVLDTKPGIQPFAMVNFQLKNSRVRLIDYFLDDATLSGSFNNHVDTNQLASDENSILKIDSSDFYYKEINIKASGSLRNLNSPFTKTKATFKGNLKAFNHYLDTAFYKFSEGSFTASLNQEGPISLITIPDPIMMKGQIGANLLINKGQLTVVKNQLEITELNGKMDFINSDVSIPSLACKLNTNQLNLNGNLTNLVPFLLFPDKNIKATLSVSSPYFNLNKMLVKRDAAKVKTDKPKSSKPFMGHLHKIIDHIQLDLKANVAKLEYKNLLTGSLIGNVGIAKEAISMTDWKLELGKKGKILLNAEYAFQDNDSGKIKMEATLSNIDASNLFFGFNNFGQKTLTSENLAGIINARIRFNCIANESFDPIQKTIKGYISLDLSEGQLINFEPLKRIGDMVFKNRDMMHIHFNHINNIFKLEGEELHIEKMTVNSSVLSLYIEGVYSFKHKTDLSIQIPLSNLKDHKEEFFKIKDKNHGNLRIRAKEKDGKMTLALDIFDRYHKKDRND